MRKEKIRWTFLDSNRILAVAIWLFILFLATIPAFFETAEGIVFSRWIPTIVFLTGPPLIFFRIHFKGGFHLPVWEKREKTGWVKYVFTGHIRPGREIYYECRRCGRIAGKIIH